MTALTEFLLDMYDLDDEVILLDDPDEDERLQTIWVYCPTSDPCHKYKVLISLTGEFIGFVERRI